MTSELTPQAARKRGRPTDPDFESRVFAAAIDVYAEVGWAGFTLNAVTARSKVGKASLYRRWASKEELIVDALLSMGSRVIPDTGSLREDLVTGTDAELREYLSPRGTVRLRAQIEAKQFPELFGAAMERYNRQRLESGRRMLGAAITRGELPLRTDLTQMLDAINGITVNHYLSTPSHRLPLLKQQSRAFAESVVDFVLRAVGAPPPDLP